MSGNVEISESFLGLMGLVALVSGIFASLGLDGRARLAGALSDQKPYPTPQPHTATLNEI